MIAADRLEWLLREPSIQKKNQDALRVLATTLLFLLGCGPAEETRLVRGPYLQMATPTSAVVRWRTNVECDGQLTFGSSPVEQSQARSQIQESVEHEIQISSLQPATRYYYSVSSCGKALAGPDESHSFTTPPLKGTRVASDSPLRIWVTGDTGRCGESTSRCKDAHSVRKAYLEFAGESTATHWLLLGDLAYHSGSDTQFTKALFETYEDVLRNTFAWPIPGNHDYGHSSAATQTGPYFEAFTLPTQGEAGGKASETEAYYAYDIGNVHFVALDSHDTDPSVGEKMAEWLRQDLQMSKADFTIAYWHHPPYSKGSHDSDFALDSGGRMGKMRESIVPILEAGGVDLHLSGHSHSYERSMLIGGHYGVSDTFSKAHIIDSGDGDPDGDGAYHPRTQGARVGRGTVYAVVGSSADSNGDLDKHPVMVRGFDYEGSLVLDINGRVLEGHWIDRDGRIRDHFQISKEDSRTGLD